MRIYASISKVDQLDDGTVEVHGIASSEAEDDQGEIVKADAMRAAIPDYMRMPALRAMHQLHAAGRTLAAEVGDDGKTRIVAHVVDPVDVTKVKNKVYNGFSIGGRVTDREPGSYKTITGIKLDEISLVDRPANPEATLDMWKRSADMDGGSGLATVGDQLAAKGVFIPVQIWACGNAEHRHIAKADAVNCVEKAAAAPSPTETAIARAQQIIAAAEGRLLVRIDGSTTTITKADDGGDKEPYGDVKYADPGYQEDKKKRYPVDSEAHIRAAWNYINKPKNAGKYSADQVSSIKGRIVSAWKAKIDKDGPPSAEDGKKATEAAMRKALWDTGEVASIIMALDRLEDSLRMEAAMEGDDSEAPTQLSAVKDALCAFLRDLVAEETEEIMDGDEVDPADLPPQPIPMGFAMASVLDRDGIGEPLRKFAREALAKARSRGDQTMMDLAYHAAKAGADLAPNAETRGHFEAAAGAMEKAGALPPDYSRAAPDTEPGDYDRANPDSGEPTNTGGDTHSTVDSAGYPESKTPNATPPAAEHVPGHNATVDTASKAVMDMIAAALGKAGRGMSHQHLAEVAHDCIAKLTDGMSCGETGKAGARHSAATMGHMREAHDHLVKCGGSCTKAAAAKPEPGEFPNPAPGGNVTTGDPEPEHQGTQFSRVGGASGDDDMATNAALEKMLTDERAEKAVMLKALGDMGVMLERVSTRVEQIAATPMPALTAGPGAALSVSKREDGGGAPDGRGVANVDDVAKTIERYTPDERAMLAIRIARTQPFKPRS